MAEAAVVKGVTRELDARGAWWVNIHGSAYGRNGIPDILAIYRGHALLIECKSATGRLRPLQRYEMGRAAAAGAVTIVARSRDDVRQALHAIDAELATRNDAQPPLTDRTSADETYAHGETEAA